MDKTETFKNLIQQLKDDEGLSDYGVGLLQACFQQEMREAIDEQLEQSKSSDGTHDELIKDIIQGAEDFKNHHDKPYDNNTLKNCLIELRNKIESSEGEGKGWVNINDEKPERFESVLIKSKNGDINISSISSSGMFHDGTKEDGGIGYIYGTYDVSYWMSLSEIT